MHKTIYSFFFFWSKCVFRWMAVFIYNWPSSSVFLCAIKVSNLSPMFASSLFVCWSLSENEIFHLNCSFYWEDVLNTQDRVYMTTFQNTSKFVKKILLRVVFWTLFSVSAWKCGQTRSFNLCLIHYMYVKTDFGKSSNFCPLENS